MPLVSLAAAPWWGSPVIAATAALGGVLLTLLGTHWRASIDLRRKDQSRWDDLVLDTATTLLALTGELAESGRVGYPRYVEDREERVAGHVRITEAVNEALARFRLVASDSLREAALDLYGAAVNEELGVKEDPSGEPVRRYADARDAFTAAVRREVRANP